MSQGGKFLSVGYGNVGQAVPERAAELGLEQAPYVIKSKGTYELGGNGELELYSNEPNFWEDPKVMDGVEVGFVTIPSHSDGLRAFDIIKGFIDKSIPVVTAEKGALANFHADLKDDMDIIGTTATVGGGTRMLPLLMEHFGPRTTRVDNIANGTNNFIIDALSRGRTLGQAVAEAYMLKFAEPPKQGDEALSEVATYLALFNGELSDTDFKNTITWNHVIAPNTEQGTIITPGDLDKRPQFSEEDLAQLKEEAEVRRPINSFIRAEHETPETDIIAGSRTEIDGWVIVSGMRRVDLNPIFKEYLMLPGPFNGAIIAGGQGESDGLYQVARGPGAGPGPTAAAAVQDARRILGL